MKLSKIKTALVIILAVIVALIAFTLWGNKALVTDTYIVESENLGTAINGYKIAQVSDLHNDEIGKDNKKLIDALKKSEPDIIVITGDLIDSRNTDVDVAVEFMEQAVKIAPCYYSNGNHEARVPDDYNTLKAKLSSIGVTILENEKTTLTINNESINLIGISDPDFYTDDAIVVTDNTIKQLHANEGFTVLLSHRPELFDVYVNNNIDLAFTGHAHGGQFRLPFIGGLYAPHQGAFPEYDNGMYTKDDTNMIVSRGIGNSIFPFRFNNRPQLVIATLKAK
ncbi:MAG: metallophosphoesterase [Ruminococcus sp.]|nr:metallophosphoesterase [Ruminococcus sp.]